MIHYPMCNSRLLPIEYLEVAYLKSTGTQYIDTGVNPTVNTTFKIRFELQNYNTFILGASFAYNDVNHQFSIYSNRANHLRVITGTNVYTFSDGSGILDVYLNNGKVYANGLSYDYTSNLGNNNTKVYLFRTSIYFASAKIYDCAFWENNILVRHFIPCYRKSDSKPGFYDLVNDKFYTNVGTGEFTVGESIIYKKEYNINSLYNSSLYNIGYSYGTEGLYDKNIYIEPDGSKWIRIFHHNDPSNNGVFSSSDTFETGVYKDENRWYDIETTVSQIEKWEFMAKLKTTSTESEYKIRWIQYKNPIEATYDDVSPSAVKRITDGYYNSVNAGGMYKSTSNNRMIIANLTNGNWFGAGCKTLYRGGFPGVLSSVVTTGYLDLYLRIDNVCPTYIGCYKLNNSSQINGNYSLDTPYSISLWYKSDGSSTLLFGMPVIVIGLKLRVFHWVDLSSYIMNEINTPDINKWHHLVMTYNGTVLKLYIDGELKNSASTLSTTAILNTFNSGSGNDYILNFRIYDDVLTDDEIKQLYKEKQ